MEEIRSGYLYKSPPSYMSKSLKSWKRRYFVLGKAGGNIYKLKYFKDENKREKQQGEIKLYEISLLFLCPKTHPSWEWIHRNFKCTPSCVLYLKVPDRDYFLIGENSDEMESWFNIIFDALNTRSHTMISFEEKKKPRSTSEPLIITSSNKDREFGEHKREKDDHGPTSSSARCSAPESFNTQYSLYDYPTSYKATELLSTQNSQKSEDEDDEEDEQKEREELDKEEIGEETNSSNYMSMEKVMELAKGIHNAVDTHLQTKLVTEDENSENLCLNCSGNRTSTALNSQIPQEIETFVPVEKEIYVSQELLRNGVIFSEEAGKPCVSDCRLIQFSNIFHKGDQILAINDLLTYNLGEVQNYLKRINKDQVKLTILRQPRSKPLSECGV
ncbi:hypothetical protein P4O66_010907 [Electrophorus voltai]|uniref:PH domain-containing protein n=1 Tax=Electrophorus voltai TaxID=2609070 RepID=A0AAD9DU29_9TELE|nr:hypothetical protein P4O66_010907 [Electrophorus voltai]